MGMRLSEGIDQTAIEERLGRPLNATKLEAQGLIARDNGRLCATAKGRMVLNTILRDLVA